MCSPCKYLQRVRPLHRPALREQHMSSIMSASEPSSNPSRMPVYFLGIGGPNFMEDSEHPAYHKLSEVGKEITMAVKPKAVVVFSAHWQGSPNKILINAAEKADLIYDFYGFPSRYYEYDYPNRGSPEIADKVIEKLSGIGVQIEKVKRGLDHGVWAGFMVGELSFVETSGATNGHSRTKVDCTKSLGILLFILYTDHLP